MPSRSFENRIRDILEAIVEIESFTEGITFEEFQQDQITVKAVLYNMAIIGEAANSLMPDIEEIYPEIPWIAAVCVMLLFTNIFRLILSLSGKQLKRI